MFLSPTCRRLLRYVQEKGWDSYSQLPGTSSHAEALIERWYRAFGDFDDRIAAAASLLACDSMRYLVIHNGTRRSLSFSIPSTVEDPATAEAFTVAICGDRLTELSFCGADPLLLRRHILAVVPQHLARSIGLAPLDALPTECIHASEVGPDGGP